MGIGSFIGKAIAFGLLGLFVFLLLLSVFLITLPDTVETIKDDFIEVLTEQMDGIMMLQGMPDYSIEEMALGCMGGGFSGEEGIAAQQICQKILSGEITTAKEARIEFYKYMLSDSIEEMEDELMPEVKEIGKFSIYPLIGALIIGGIVVLLLRLSTGSFLGALKSMCGMLAIISLFGVIGIFLVQSLVPPMIEEATKQMSMEMGSGSLPVNMDAINDLLTDNFVKWAGMVLNPVFYVQLFLLVGSVGGWVVFTFVFKGGKKKEKQAQGGTVKRIKI